MVTLRPMTADEFRRFKDYSIPDYARDLTVAEGLAPEEALIAAEAEFHKLMPDGPDTEGQFVMTVEDAHRAQEVGWIWFFKEQEDGETLAFIADFLIFEPERRKGYATAALIETEKIAKAAGCAAVGLWVWDHNPAAQALYQKCGFKAAERDGGGTYMKKAI
ncbi:MAG: GNAT family N-acetyltransferase [Clostridia bacterium]|nr:GNAT family N-acetyltransferase [Clostridia bacterium]